MMVALVGSTIEATIMRSVGNTIGAKYSLTPPPWALREAYLSRHASKECRPRDKNNSGKSMGSKNS